MSTTWTDPERLDKLFEHVAYEVAASGGDGGGTVVFHATDVQAVASAFETWRVKSPWAKWLPYRDDFASGHVLFSDRSNEGITFVSKAVADTWGDHVGGHEEVRLEVW